MAFYPPITISNALNKIDFNQYLVPAIQREFEWGPEKIEMLFDSLMRNYPIGSFLLWQVTGARKTDHRYYAILKKYRERYETHCPEVNAATLPDFEAVLDGQQRLTALYIGLKGSYAYKLPHRQWRDTEHAIPTRLLYLRLNALAAQDDTETEVNEDGRLYDFRFMTNDDRDAQADSIWFPVGKILELQGTFKLGQFMKEKGWDTNDFINQTLSKLHDVVHVNQNIHYYLETDQDYDKALNIFIRINSGGLKLDYSDLVMSTTIAGWKGRDARQEVNNLIKELWDSYDFKIDKDLVLRTYLILFREDIKFRVNNFSLANAREFEANWEGIRNAIVEAFQLINDYGYSEHSLTSKNAVLPIIYYLYKSGRSDGFSTKVKYDADRKVIRKWVHAVLLHKIFGGAAEGVIKVIRDVVANEVAAGVETFPAHQIAERLSKTRKSITVDDEFISSLLDTQYEDRYAFPILALLYPFLDFKNRDFHKDHLHPKSWFTKKSLKERGIEADSPLPMYYNQPECFNGIVNLQLLDGNLNKSKNASSLEEWLKNCDVDRVKQMIPEEVAFEDFPDFVQKRERLLKDKLKAELTQ